MAVTVDSLSIEIGYQANNASEGIDKLVESLRRLRSACRISALQKLADGINGLNAALNSVDPSSVQNVSDLSNAIQRMSGARMPRGGFNVNVNTNEVNAAADAVGDLNDTERDNAEATGNVAQEADRASGGLARMRSSFATLADRIKRSNGFLKTFWNAIKRIAFYRLIRSMIKAITDAFKEGIHNAYQFSKAIDYRLATAMDKVSSATMKMKNQLGSLGAEVISAVSPVLIRLAKIITWVADKMAQFLAAMQGYSTYLKATDVSKPWEEGADAVKKYKSNLQGFDELNVIETSSSSGTDYSDMFEVVDVSEKIKKFAETIKKILEGVKEHFEQLLPLITAIGTALLAWKLSKALGTSFTKTWGILMAIAGAIQLIKGFWDAWVNGLNTDNLNTMLGGALSLIAGLTLAFGGLGGVIGALISSFALLVIGIKNYITTGEMSNETTQALWIGITGFGGSLGWIIKLWVLFKNAETNAKKEGKSTFDYLDERTNGLSTKFIGFVIKVLSKIEEIKRKVKSFFTDFGSNAQSKFNEIVSKFKGMVSQLGSSINGFATNVGNVFRGIGNTIKETFVGSINAALNSVFEKVENSVNSFIKSINGIINILNAIPGVNIKELGELTLPRLASGGIAYSETTAIIGEQGKEAVLPLENNTQWMDILADKVSQNINVTFTVKEDPKGLFEVTQEEAAKFVRRTNRPPYPSPSRA